MIYLPPLRRFLLPALVSIFLIILYKTIQVPRRLPLLVLHPPPVPPPGIRVSITTLQKPLPIFNASSNHLSPPNAYFYDSHTEAHAINKSSSPHWQLGQDPSLAPLFKCQRSANPYTGHIRLPNFLQNISEIPSASAKKDLRNFWNPTIIALPYWSENQYLIVSRILTDGNHQENVLCEANACYAGTTENARPGERPCTQDDLRQLGPAGGMRCVSPPVTLSVPPTPADKCEGKFGTYVDIPGFHDPRIFWSGKGEPLMMVNTQSRYACFGLWMIDLRSLHPPLQMLLASSPSRPSLGPLKSYSTLTELTRNPPSTRVAIEKNWLLFFPSSGESYVQYELSSHPTNGSNHSSCGRTFAKLLGNGLTTTNLTDSLEQPCLHDFTPPREPGEAHLRRGTWHQATNSLRLILCNRVDPTCHPVPNKTIFFAIIHRKLLNELKLPLRYERFVIAWSATAPFSIVGISAHPILLFNETATGFSAVHNWADEEHTADTGTKTDLEKRASTNQTVMPSADQRGLWAYFTYTVSIAYDWGRKPRNKGGKGGVGDEAEDMHVGYLDDEVMLGIGVDDKGQAFSRVKARDLVACMRACPSVAGV